MQQFLKEINEIVDFKKVKCTQSSKKKVHDGEFYVLNVHFRVIKLG
jgi:hypothetical protein